MKSKKIIVILIIGLIFIACKNEPPTNIIESPFVNYNGKFTFITISNSFVLTSTVSRDTTIFEGNIDCSSTGIATIQYKNNKNITFQLKDNGTFVSEGDFYYYGGKEGGFIGLDSVAFHIKGPGQREGSNDWIVGKRKK